VRAIAPDVHALVVAQGRSPSLVARVAGISRQAIYRRPSRPPKGQRRALDATDRIVLDGARSHPIDRTRMVAALAARQTRGAVNRKRVQRLMREHAVLQPKRSEGHGTAARPLSRPARGSSAGWCVTTIPT
jgi:putative transposase